VLIFCYSIFRFLLHFDCVVIDLVIMLDLVLYFASFSHFFSVLAKRLSGKSVPKMTCFMSSGTLSICSVSHSINQSVLPHTYSTYTFSTIWSGITVLFPLIHRHCPYCFISFNTLTLSLRYQEVNQACKKFFWQNFSLERPQTEKQQQQPFNSLFLGQPG